MTYSADASASIWQDEDDVNHPLRETGLLVNTALGCFSEHQKGPFWGESVWHSESCPHLWETLRLLAGFERPL